MNRIIYRIVFFLFILENIFLFLLLIKVDLSDNMPQEIDENDSAGFNLCFYLKKNTIPPGKLEDNFPYEAYLNSVSFPSVEEIKSNLKCLDMFFKDSSMNRQVLSYALTDKLVARTKLKTYSPDSLLKIVQWAEKFQNYAKLDVDNNTDILYSTIYDSWMNFVSADLMENSKKKPSLKYDFEYKYLLSRCNEKQYSIPVKVTSFEKAILMLIYSDWGHLINASWHQSTWKLKALVFAFAIITVIGFSCIISKLLKIYKNLTQSTIHIK